MTDFDPTRIEGKFSEPVILTDHRLVLGLIHLDGAGIRVCAWDGEHTRHMSQAAALRLAKGLEGEAGLEPVVEALERLAARVSLIQMRVTAERAQKFADMPVEGHA